MTTIKNNIYYDPEKGNGGLQDFIRKYNAENKKKITRKEALNYLQQQDTYTLHRPSAAFPFGGSTTSCKQI